MTDSAPGVKAQSCPTLRYDRMSGILTTMSGEQTYGERLRAEREGRGLSIEDATFLARTKLGRSVSARTVGRLENGTTAESAADERLVIALCRVYEVDPYAISIEIADRAHDLVVLLGGNTTSKGRAKGRQATGRYSQSGRRAA